MDRELYVSDENYRKGYTDGVRDGKMQMINAFKNLVDVTKYVAGQFEKVIEEETRNADNT